MVSRTTQTVVCFSSTFGLPDVDGPQPAGSYRVDHDEESIESLTRLAWRRVASFIYLPGIGQHGSTHQMVQINPVELDAALEKDQKNHDGLTILQRNARPIRYEAATHLFTTGQIVRLKAGFGLQSQSADTYRITATLPPRGDSQQYRIRNDDEHYERVATQDSLEPVNISPAGRSGALIEETFGRWPSDRSAAIARSEKPNSEKDGPSLTAQEIG
jgi:hypothetical protein